MPTNKKIKESEIIWDPINPDAVQWDGEEPSLPQTPTENKMPLSDMAVSAVKNIPSSGLQLAQDIGTAVAHPIDTASAIGSVVQGGLQKTIPGEQGKEPQFDAVINFFKDRYGGIENIKKTVATDPVGFLTDIASVFTGAGAGLKGAGAAGKIEKISKAGEIASRIGSVIDPISATANTLKQPVHALGKAGSQMLGVTTGAGANAIKEAYRGGQSFTDALRGNIKGEQILNESKSALQVIKDERASNYISKLEKISTDERQLSIVPVNKKLEQLKKNFNIQETVLDDGKRKYDFSRSTLDEASQKDVQKVLSLLDDWGNQPKDFTPVGLDLLKRRLDDIYSPSHNSRAFITAIKNSVKDVLVREVKNYKSMVGDYEKMSGLINEIQRTLSLGNKASVDAGIRKLTSALKENNDFRRVLVKKLDEHSYSNIQEQIAGYSMSSYIPQGLIGRSLGAAQIYGFLTTFDPSLAAMLFTASPRVSGEFINVLGRAIRGSKRIRKPYIPQTAFQAGRLRRILKQQQQEDIQNGK